MSKIETKGLFSDKDIELAWERVVASVGNDVKDYFGINVFDSNIAGHLRMTFDELDSNTYNPTKPFKYFEPKKCGTQRTKTVLNIKDAIIYQAIADKIGESVYETLDRNRNFVFGSVLNQNVQKGVSILEEDEQDFYFFEYYVNLYNRFVEGIGDAIGSGEVQYKLETDITGFFDCIPHSVLLLKLYEYGIDKDLLDLLSVCLNTWSGTRDNITLNVGIPQGPPASFLLANILLDELDELITDQGVKYYRFMDDMRVYAETRDELLDILVDIDRYLKGHSLSLNTSKTQINIVENENDYEDLILDSSGIPFEDKVFDLYNSDCDAEEDDFKSVQQTERIEKLATEEIVVQDTTQLYSNSSSAYSHKISRFLIKSIESELLTFFDKHKDIKDEEILPDENIREFLTLAQRWRSLVSSIKTGGDYHPNKELVNIWFFGINHLYWKTNSMAWNLNHYDNLEEFSNEYQKLLTKFSRFEWVKYQLLSVFYKVYPNNEQRHLYAIEELRKERSPLVRLGYYSVLVESIKENSSLFNSYSQALANESDNYVKEAILSSIHYKNTQVSIQTLKEWFLK